MNACQKYRLLREKEVHQRKRALIIPLRITAPLSIVVMLATLAIGVFFSTISDQLRILRRLDRIVAPGGRD